MRLFGGLPSIAKVLRRASLALGALLCVGALATPAAAQLTVSMTVPPPFNANIQPGDTTALKITITNGNPGTPLTGTNFNLNLRGDPSSQLQIVDAGHGNGGVESYTCTRGDGVVTVPENYGSGLVTAPAGATTLQLSGGTVPVRDITNQSGKCELTILVTSTLTGGNTFFINANAVQGNDGSAQFNGQTIQQTITPASFTPPTITKLFDAASVTLGNSATVTLRIQNNSSVATLPLNGASNTPPYGVQDNLPAGLLVDGSFTPTKSADCGTATINAVNNTTVAEVVGGTIPANGLCEVKFKVKGTTVGLKTNTINASTNFKTIRGVNANGNASASITVNSSLAAGVSFAANPIPINQESTFTVTFQNLGGADLHQGANVFTGIPGRFDLSETSPTGSPTDGLVIQSVDTTANPCPGAVVNIGPNGKTYTVTGATFVAGQTCSIRLRYKGFLTDPGTSDQTFTNFINANDLQTTEGVSNTFVSASVSVYNSLLADKYMIGPTGNLIGQNDTGLSLGGGQVVRYKLTVGNFGPAAKLVVTDPLPAGMKIVTVGTSPVWGSNAPLYQGDDPVACANVTLDQTDPTTPVFTYTSFPGTTIADAKRCDIFFSAQIPQNLTPGDDLTNTLDKCHFRIDSGSGATSGGRNPALGTGVCALRGTGAPGGFAAPITIGQAFSAPSAGAGTTVTLTYTLTNLGGTTLQNAAFTNTLPGPLPNGVVVAATPNIVNNCGGTFTAAAGTKNISLSGGSVGPRANGGLGTPFGSCTISVDVTGTAGVYNNVIAGGAFTGGQTQPDNSTLPITNGSQPVNASITFEAALNTTKSFSPSTVSSGGLSRVTIILQNASTGPYNNVSVSDPLPAGMVLATPPSASTTCGGSPSITAAGGASNASLSGVVLPAGATCTFEFNVIATGGSNWTNTIPAGNITATGGVINVTPISATLNNGSSASVTVVNTTLPSALTAPGQTSVLKVTLTNPGSVTLTNLGLTDYLTSDGTITGANQGFVIAANPNQSTDCLGGTVTVLNETSFRLSGATLAGGNAQCSFQVNVTLVELGSKNNFIPIGSVTNDQNISNTALASTNLALSGDIGVVKAFSPVVVKPNVVSRLTVTLYNLLAATSGNSQQGDVNNIQFTDSLPSGLTVASPANAATTCTSATITGGSPGGTTIGITGGHLNSVSVGSSTPQTCTVAVDVVSPTLNAYTNNIPIAAVTGLNNSSGVQNVVAAAATLQVRTPVTITKSFASPTRLPGQVNTASITFTNPNNIALTNASLIDNLPSGLFVAPTPSPTNPVCGGTFNPVASASSVSLTGATLPAGSACTITFQVVSNIAGTYVNTIPAAALGTLLGVTNENPASAQFVVKDPPSVAKSFSPPSIPAGGTSTLTITLNNTNTAAAALSSTFTDNLPSTPGQITVSGAASGTCTGVVIATLGASSVSYQNGSTVPPGGCTIIVPVTGSTNGVHTNTINAGDLQTDAGNNVQPASAALTISPKGYISGRVFRDNNVTPDGVFNGTDAGIAGVTMTLTGVSYGPDGVAGGGDDFAITPVAVATDAVGVYGFYELDPGSYTVTETEPSGLLNGIVTAGSVVGPGGGTAGAASSLATIPSTVTNVILLTSGGQTSGSPNNNFAEVAPGTISGLVFNDLNDNGAQDSGDTAIGSVTIELYAGATITGSPIQTVTTNGSGAYSFTGLAPGVYSVREPSQPPATTDGKTTAGAVGNGGSAGTASTQGTTPSTILNITLPPGTTTSGNNFAELTSGRSISGTVYIDTDDNGLLGGSEVGIGGVTINLSGASTASTVTDSNGNYTFSGLAAGVYNVTEAAQPSNTTDGKTTAGSTGGLATNVGVAPSSITGIDLNGANTNSTGNNFGERNVVTPPSAVTISGKVYTDTNDNGAVDGGEAGVPGVTVTLTGTDINGDPVNLTTTTNATGDYVFTPPASNSAGYVITEIQPSLTDGKTTAPSGTATSSKPVSPGAPDTIAGVVVGASSLTGYNFGERAGGAVISGKVYKDRNDNGVVDAGEDGIAGVTVTLTGTSAAGAPINLTTTTDAAGAYNFTAPPSNSAGYTITEIQPGQFTDGKTTAPGIGSATASKPVAAGGQDTITGVVLTTNPLSGFNFGERDQAAKLTGYVFADANSDGVRNSGEAGIAGVTITLTGTSAGGAAVALTTTTAADGTFVFNNVPPSNDAGYVLTQTQPSGFTDGRTLVAAGQPGSPNSSKQVNVGDQDRIVGVAVPANTNRGDYIFAEVPVLGLKPPIVNGYVYLDRRHTRIRPTDGSIEGQSGWTVTLRQNGQVICTTTTNDKGFYQFDNLHCRGYEASGLPTGTGFSITFDKDGSNLPAVPTSGGGRGEVVPTGGEIRNITLLPSDQVVEQNLPLDPAGVVYDTVKRTPVKGAVITIDGPAGFDPARHLVGGTAAHIQTVGDDGLYQFLLQNDFPSGVYVLTVTAPGGYLPFPSTTIAPCPGVLPVTLNPNPALLQQFDNAPPSNAPAGCPGLVPGGSATTQYYLQFNITRGGSADILNNHIPLDPQLSGALFITKTSPMVNVSRGDLVPYTITATNTQTTASGDVTIRDQLPPGFQYRTGSAARNGVRVEPNVAGGFVTWPAETFQPKEKKTYSLMLVVGSGVSDGDYVNRAWGSPPGGGPVTNIAAATVRITPDPTFDCPDIIGKVFDDKNANGYQDEGEPGIPAVRVSTANGLLITSDAEGRFHIPCPATPDMDRGSNFVLKLDPRTLPSGFRLTTENPASIRVTRGKMVKLNFGATIHRVVRVELSDAAFEAGSAVLKAEYRASLDTMPQALAERPSVVRIAYRYGADGRDLAKKRIETVRAIVRDGWKAAKGRYPLAVEAEESQ